MRLRTSEVEGFRLDYGPCSYSGPGLVAGLAFGIPLQYIFALDEGIHFLLCRRTRRTCKGMKVNGERWDVRLAWTERH
jgi:hypothetical protein